MQTHHFYENLVIMFIFLTIANHSCLTRWELQLFLLTFVKWHRIKLEKTMNVRWQAPARWTIRLLNINSIRSRQWTEISSYLMHKHTTYLAPHALRHFCHSMNMRRGKESYCFRQTSAPPVPLLPYNLQPLNRQTKGGAAYLPAPGRGRKLGNGWLPGTGYVDIFKANIDESLRLDGKANAIANPSLEMTIRWNVLLFNSYNCNVNALFKQCCTTSLRLVEKAAVTYFL